jgi:HD-GYP domain-containing protein (c-di-GMP phosphodiesterase class II)
MCAANQESTATVAMQRRRPGLGAGALIWTVLLLLPMAYLVASQLFPAIDPSIHIEVPHFIIVSFTSLLAGVIALVVAVAARRLRDARAFFLALCYACIGLVFGIHGLATPGVVLADPGITVGLSAILSLFLGSVFLALASVQLPLGVMAWVARRQGVILLAVVAAIVAYGALALLTPSMVASTLAATSTTFGTTPAGSYGAITEYAMSPLLYYGVPLISIGLLLFAARGYLRSFLLSGSRFQFALFVSIVLLAQAIVSMVVTPVWHASWWLYHGLMLASFLITLTALVLEYSGGRGVAEALRRIGLRETFAQLEGSYGPPILALLAALEAKDPYTRGHGDRVARVSVAIGEELKLPAAQLRLLAQAGVLHDVGKIAVPEEILNKPGKLTDAEFVVIKKHPGDGGTMVSTVATLRQIIAIVRAHHERFDGRGYPDGLEGEGIPLEARIIAVADVYDALTSYRSYRTPWPRERVLEEVRAGSGTHFDPAVAAAMERVVEQWGGTEKLPEHLPPDGYEEGVAVAAAAPS